MAFIIAHSNSGAAQDPINPQERQSVSVTPGETASWIPSILPPAGGILHRNISHGLSALFFLSRINLLFVSKSARPAPLSILLAASNYDEE